jgi:hypothetical protein
MTSHKLARNSSQNLLNNVDVNDSPPVETGPRGLSFRGMSVSNQRFAPTSLLHKTSRVETGYGAIYSGSFRKDRGRPEVFHG